MGINKKDFYKENKLFVIDKLPVLALFDPKEIM